MGRKDTSMPFSKTGVVPIQKVLCGCGQELAGRLDKCPRCGKTIVPVPGNLPKQEEEEDKKDATK